MPVEEVRMAPLSKLGTIVAIRHGFSNWYGPVLRLMAKRLLHVRRPITWRSRYGAVLVTAAGDGSSHLMPELFGLDEYHLLELPSDAVSFVVDIGANVGAFSLRVAELFPGVRVSAFEPSPREYARLNANVQANPLLGAIEPRRCAVVGVGGTREIELWEDAKESPCNTIIESLVRDRAAGRWVKAPAISLASVLSTAGSVDLLKLDVEGAEYEILGETSSSAFAEVRRIVLEYHPVEGHHFGELVEALVAAGFQFVRHQYVVPGIGLLWFDRDAPPGKRG